MTIIDLMVHTYKESDIGSFFGFSTDYIHEHEYFSDYDNLINIHWNRSGLPIGLEADGEPLLLGPGQLCTTTYLNKVRFTSNEGQLTTFAFNRPFYCIIDHDHEVSCNGILFFGNQRPPVVTLSDSEIPKFEMIHEVMMDEYQTRDRVQGEMLRVLLKRLIIKTTRLAKDQLLPREIDDEQVDVIRKFKVLVDVHFREYHQVSDYADLLFKSPKTLSNLFKQLNQQTPLQIIHERIVLEAKRKLIYTDKSVKEVAIDLGFNDLGSFHRLFKRTVN